MESDSRPVKARGRYEAGDGIATITLNRPDKLNAYTPEMGEAVVAAFERAGAEVATFHHGWVRVEPE